MLEHVDELISIIQIKLQYPLLTMQVACGSSFISLVFNSAAESSASFSRPPYPFFFFLFFKYFLIESVKSSVYSLGYERMADTEKYNTNNQMWAYAAIQVFYLPPNRCLASFANKHATNGHAQQYKASRSTPQRGIASFVYVTTVRSYT